MEKNTYFELMKFLEEFEDFTMLPTTVFFEDLNLIGLDAIAFLSNFEKKFDVDMSNFKFDDYFHEVVPIPFWYILQRKFVPKKKLSVAELVDIIDMGEWPDKS